jgi:outer membrane protein assembly factor BamB
MTTQPHAPGDEPLEDQVYQDGSNRKNLQECNGSALLVEGMRSLRVWLFVLASFLPGAVPAQARAPDDGAIVGRWGGTAGNSLDRVEITLEIGPDSAGRLKVRLYLPVGNYYGLELPGALERDGPAFVLRAWRLSLTPTPRGLSGTLFATNVPVVLERTTKLPAEVPVPDVPRGPGPRWATMLGAPIYAPAALRDGVAYVGTSGGMFYAVRLSDGAFVWAFAAGRGVFGGATATDNAVYFVCDNGFLYKLDRRAGTEIWRHDLGDAQAARILPHQVVENSGDFDFDTRGPTPVLAVGILYVGSGDGSVHAVDEATGRRVWRSDVGGKVRGTAVVTGDRVVVGTFAGQLKALDRRTRTELWQTRNMGPIVGGVALVGDRIVAGSRYGALAAFDLVSGTRHWFSQLWGSSAESEATPAGDGRFLIGSSDLRRVALMDAQDGLVIWRTDVHGWAWPRPTLAGSIVLVSTIGVAPYQMRHLGSLSALDRETGQLRWRWPAPGADGVWMTGFHASPTVDGEVVVVGGLNGALYAFPLR